ncbi:MAG: M28 family peptidase, partial [Nitrospinota bacterium]
RRLVEGFMAAAGRYVAELPVRSHCVFGKGRLLPPARRSDHAPFWDRGFQAAMLTDTANFRNPHYHRGTDTPYTLNYPFLAGVTRALVAWALSPDTC